MRHAVHHRPAALIAVSIVLAALLAVVLVPASALRALGAPAGGSISIDFEDETLGGWQQNGSPTLAYVEDPADSLNTVLSVSGRANGYDGIQSPVGAFDEGVTYTVTAKVRTAGVANNAHFTFNEPGASNEYAWVATTGTGALSEWVTMSGTFTPGAGAANAKLYMEVEGLLDYLIDDIVITGEAIEEPCLADFTLDFEDETLSGWSQNGAPTLAYVADPADAENTVLSVSGRTNGYDGIQSPVGAFDEGVTYTVTAKVRTAGVDQNAHFTFNEPGASNEYAWVATASTGEISEWVAMSGTFTPGAGAASAKLYMEVEGLVDYLIDDIVVTSPCEPEPCEPTVVEHTNLDFGTDTGSWGQNGNPTSLDIVDDGTGTNNVLRVVGRSADFDGIQSVAGAFEAGTLYTVTGKIRLAPGTDSSTAARFVMKPAYTWGVNATGITDDEWTTLEASYAIAPDADTSELQLYIGTDNLADATSTFSYELDDIVITYEEPCSEGPAPGTVMLEADFEDGLQGWIAREAGSGAHTVAVTDTDAHGGLQSALVSGRTSQGSGLGYNVDGVLEPGQQYEITAWVKFQETPVDDIVLSVQTGASTFANLLTFTGMSNGEWVQVNGKFTIGAGDLAFLYFETPWEGADVTGNTSAFMVDDITVVVPEPAVIEDLTPIMDTVNFPMGVAIDQRETVGVSADLLLKHFNQITAENYMKPEAWYDTEGNWAPNAAQIDSLMDFAVDNDLDVYGHVLVWHSQTPAFFFQDDLGNPLTTSETDKQILRDRMRDHIFNVAEYLHAWGDYGDTNPITAWDVVNEVVDDSAAYEDGLRRSQWYSYLGEEFIHLAFEYADEAFNDVYAAPASDRPVALFINDYNTEQNGKRGRYLALIDRMIAAETPIDGIGHQFHVNLSMPVTNLGDALEDASGRGLLQAVTELDVTTGTPESEAKFIDQGYYYKEAFEIFRDYEAELFCVTVWGLIDSRSWRDANGGPLVFDDEFQAKPAYYGIVQGYSDEDPLPAPLRTANVFAGNVPINSEATGSGVWNRLPLNIIDGATGWQARWAEDHLTVYVMSDDATIDAADEVTFYVGEESYTVNRDGTGDVSAYAAEHVEGYSLVAHVPLTGATEGGTVEFDVSVNDNGTAAGWNAEGVLGTLTLVEELSYVEIPQATATPVIDGTRDSVWDAAAEVSTTLQVTGADGAVGVFELLWENNMLYLFATVEDSDVDVSGSDPWTQDSIEVYVDGGNFKNGSYRYDDTQIRINAQNVVSFGTGDEAFQANRVESATTVGGGGYTIEASISLLEYGGISTFHGVDFQVNDATGGARTSIRNWADPTGAGYQSTARWGVAQLVDEIPQPVEFIDVSEDHQFFTEIMWLADQGITTGYGDGTFRPMAPVSRQAMAVFLYRAAGEPAFADPVTASFSDVPTDHLFFTEIEWMIAEGIAGGYSDGTFRPLNETTRMAMSAFLYRFDGSPAYTPPGVSEFSDVPTDHTFYDEISWLADEGISGGYSDGTFRPGIAVSRQAMAAFLYRLLDGESSGTPAGLTPYYSVH
jgi:endo-1,4-beta-xylanase